MKSRFLICLFALFLIIPKTYSQSIEFTELVEAANHFIDSLTPEQQEKALLSLEDDDRKNWHFIPKVRKGLPMSEMTPAQRHLAMAFLNTGLSVRGFMKTTTIMYLEQILFDLNENAPTRNPLWYYFAFYGKPNPTKTWGWRMEGHHFSVNFTVHNGKVVSTTPLFMGSNPAMVLDGPNKGLRVLGPEEDLGRELVKSLNEEQKAIAVIAAEAPADIITSAERKVDPLSPAGLSAAQMDEKQRELLFTLIREYIYRARPIFVNDDLKKIEEAGLENIHFAWAGDFEPMQKHYYRVQGPTFLLEYDNTQNNGNHAHTVWRDFEGDFGEDALKEHYEESHPPQEESQQ